MQVWSRWKTRVVEDLGQKDSSKSARKGLQKGRAIGYDVWF